jgi:hypothetical protein
MLSSTPVHEIAIAGLMNPTLAHELSHRQTHPSLSIVASESSKPIDRAVNATYFQLPTCQPVDPV